MNISFCIFMVVAGANYPMQKVVNWPATTSLQLSKISCMEIWKDIIGYEGYYQVSNMGRVRSLDRKVRSHHNSYRISRGAIKKPCYNRDGYTHVVLYKNHIPKTHLIHRLVAIHFIPNLDNKPQVNHKGSNGDKTNNHISNLEWATHVDNMKHAYRNGLVKNLRCENHQNSKLTNSDVILIRGRLDSGERGVLLAREFGVSTATISMIKSRRRWATL